MVPGHVAVFKGRVGSPDHALVHLSITLAESGRARLVLTINPVDRFATRA